MFKKRFERLLPLYEKDYMGGSGAEEQNFANSASDEGGNNSGFADLGGVQESFKPSVQTLEERAAFAEMRRQNEQLLRELQERDAILSLFFDGEDPVTEALAYYEGCTPEEIQAEWAAQYEQDLKDSELAQLRAYRAQNTFKNDLDAIRAAYPEFVAASMEEMPNDFLEIMATGRLDPVTAYEIVTAQQRRGQRNAPPEIGRVNSNTLAQNDYLTMDDVRGMSQKEVRRNWDKIQKSRAKWR